MILFPWQEREVKTIWRVEKKGRSGLLVGTAHFSPIRFTKSLTRVIGGVDTVLFEGPLDKESLAAVARYGRNGEGTPSLLEALDPAVIRGVNALLAPRFDRGTSAATCLSLLGMGAEGFLEANCRGVRPWMAFFTVWTAFLNYRHSMDLEAFEIAGRLGKRISWLETIPDQLAALDAIPFDRIVRYFGQYKRWGNHRDFFTRVFLAGELDNYLSRTGEFPTRCEAILGRRDPVFFEGIRSAFDKGPAAAFVGVGHIAGLRGLFSAAGYTIVREEKC
jgi:uncharacterized protein YbaP (TraB family)